MKKRIVALVCCLSLTVGLFSCQPPKAKALLTEASLATSVIWTFMQSAGLSFSGNNAGSQQWIDSCQRWYNKFMESKEDNAGGFVGWLGYDSWSAFLADIRYQKNPTNLGYQMFIPKAISSKLAEFTSWFIGQTGLISGGDAKIISSDSCPVPRTFIDRFIKDVSSSLEVISNKWVFPYFYYGMFDFQGTIMYYLACSEKKGSWILDGSYWWVKDVGTSYSAYVYSDGTYNSAPSLKSVFFADGRKNASLGYFTASAGSISVTQPGTYSPVVDDTGDKATVVTIPGLDGEFSGIEDLLQKILDKLAANELKATGSVADTDTPDVPATDVGWKGTIEKIYQGILALPQAIADAIKAVLEALFAPDAALMQEMTDAFKGKFSFLPTLHKVGTDLFGMTAETDPPVIWVHLEDAEGKYTYGGPVKALDLSWYQRYKADVDKLISGFLWLAFLWLLFKRAASIIHGGEMYTEYASNIRDYYRSGKKDDGPTVPTNRRLNK